MTGPEMQAEWDQAAAIEALRNLRRRQLCPTTLSPSKGLPEHRAEAPWLAAALALCAIAWAALWVVLP